MGILLASAAPSAFAGPLAKAQMPAFHENEGEAEATIEFDSAPGWLPATADQAAAFKLDELPAIPLAAPRTTFPSAESQSAITRAIRSGYSVSAEPESFPARMSRAYAVSPTLQAGLRADFDAPVGDVMNLTTASAETRLTLGSLGPAISWGWHTGVDMAAQPDTNSAFASGPQFRFGDDRLAVTLSPKVAHTFGTEHASEVAFTYSAGIKGALADGVALGIEAFRATSDIAAAPGASLQNYRTSPGVYVGLGLMPSQLPVIDGSKLSLEVGAMADIKEAGPDWTGKLKAAVTW